MKSLLDLVGNFPKAHLLVVGDLMLDRFVWGDVERISPEAPVPVLRVRSESSRLGGAANVIHNIRSLGGQVTACGVIGKDEAAKRILQELRRVKASSAGVFSDRAFPTIQKTRIIASPRHQQIVRLDREDLGSIRAATLARLRRWLWRSASRYDAIVSDVKMPGLCTIVKSYLVGKGPIKIGDRVKAGFRTGKDATNTCLDLYFEPE